MSPKVIHATGFKRALDLFKEGKHEEAEAVLKSLQDEFLAILEENELLKEQLTEVADVLDMADKIEFDGQKYWLHEDGIRQGPYCQVCYDRDGLLVHLQEHNNHWECQGCRNLFMRPRDADEKSGPFRKALQKTLPLFLETETG